MHEFNPWFNDQSFTHTALSTHTHQAASRANLATCTWTSARGIIRVTTGLAPFIAIEAKPYCVVLFKKAHLIEARSIVEESSHDAEVLGRRDAELDGGLGYTRSARMAASSPVRSIRIRAKPVSCPTRPTRTRVPIVARSLVESRDSP